MGVLPLAQTVGCSFPLEISRPCSIAAAGISPKNMPPAYFLYGETLSGFESHRDIKITPVLADEGTFFGADGGIRTHVPFYRQTDFEFPSPFELQQYLSIFEVHFETIKTAEKCPHFIKTSQNRSKCRKNPKFE